METILNGQCLRIKKRNNEENPKVARGIIQRR